MNPTHLHDAEGDGADGLTTVSKPVVAERIVDPTNDAGRVDYEAEVAVGREALDDDELRASVLGRSEDGMLVEEVVGV